MTFKQQIDYLSPYMKPYRFPVGVSLFFVLVSTALDQASPWIIKLIVDLLIENGVEDSYTKSKIFEYLWILGGISFISAILLFFQRYLLITSSRKSEYALRKNLFDKFQIQPRSFFDKNPIGDLMSRSTNDLDHVRDIVGPVILHITRMGLLLIYTGLCLYWISPTLAVVGLGFSLCLPLISMRFMKFLYKTYSTNQKFLGRLNTFVQETVSGISIIKAFNAEQLFRSRFETSSAEFKETSKKVAFTNSLIWPSISLIGGVGICASILAGAYLVQQGDISIGDLSAAVLYLVKVQFPLVGLGWVISLVQRGRASLDRIIELENQMETQDTRNQGQAFTETFQSIHLQNLGLELSDTPILKDINIHLEQGKSLGIVGATGSGKTMLANVISGIYTPSTGSILMNQQLSTDLKVNDYRSQFSIAPQSGFLFSDSIKNNILMGSQLDPSQVPQERIDQAVVTADFAKDLPDIQDGLEAMLGEKGINLSGGQKQRVGLSRALIADKPILILDDTLSALDTETEAQVLKNLKAEISHLTTIVISHRYSSVCELDEIIVLEDGMIIERGPHSELLKLKGQYWDTWEKQQITSDLEGQ